MFELIFMIAVCGCFLEAFICLIGAKAKFKKVDKNEALSATVIVAARDEEDNIERCLKSLDLIDYPDSLLEIIIVDDRSTDKTGEIIDNYIQGKPKFKKIVTKKEIGRLRGKTNALANAIEIAKGKIIFTTDADCTVLPTWVKSTVKYYAEDVAAVNGYTTQEAYNCYSGMQALDFIYLLTLAAGTINLGAPISCMGNNMSFLKKAYLEVGGYQNLPFSVTEDFNLLYAIYKLKKYKIILPLNPESLVTSVPVPDYITLAKQKKRWGVGGLSVPARGYVIFVLGYLSALGVLATPFFYNSFTWITIALFKIFIDFMVVVLINNRLGMRSKVKYFPAFELYFLIYAFLLPFLVFFNQKVQWKGREY
jgi:cellulose synthase/poly-beta-1,6-N-acetylglucosamine synthase-like glycosyltransferase